MKQNQRTEGAMFGAMLMGIGKPEWLLRILVSKENKIEVATFYYWNDEHCYMKIGPRKDEYKEDFSDEYCAGVKDAYKAVTNIPFERAIIRYEMDGNMLKDGEWIFIDEADSGLQNLRLDWKSQNELDSQHVPRLQTSEFWA